MSWIRTAKIGDKVTPIDEEEPWYVEGIGYLSCSDAFPVFGRVYTIAGFTKDTAGVVHLYLDELQASPDPSWVDPPAYSWEGFRPVEPRKTEISVFERMLKTVGKPVEEVE